MTKSTQTWFRRMHFILFVSAFFIFIHKITSLLYTQDEFFKATYIYYRNIITNKSLLLPFIAIYCCLFGVLLINKFKKKAEIFVTICIITGILLWRYPQILQTLTPYYEYFLLVIAMMIFIALVIEKTRKLLRKAVWKLAIWSVIIAVYTTIFFEVLIQKTDAVFLIESYWFELKASVYALKTVTDPLAFGYFVLLVVTIYVSLIKSLIFHIKRSREKETVPSKLPPVGVVIPAYNEENTILQTVNSVLKAKNVSEILIVNDGSKDKTLSLLLEVFNMRPVHKEKAMNVVKTKEIIGVYRSLTFPHLYVVDKVNGGKHDALNAGFQMLSKNIDYVANIDADVLLKEDSVTVLLQDMVRKKAIAASGLVLPKETNKFSILQKIQTLEYLTAFHISRAAYALTNNLMIISGAFGMFERVALVAVRGYKPTIGEDMFLCMELQNRRCKLLYVPDAVIYTAAPLSLKDLKIQRVRWFKGLMESLLRFKNFARNRMAFAYLEFFFVEFLTPLMLPFGTILLVCRPEILTNPFFLICATILIASYFLQLIVAIIIECKYRRGFINLSHILTFLTLPLYAVMTLVWRNDAYLDRSSRKWGSITKSL